MKTKITLMLIAGLLAGSEGATVIPVSDPGFDTYDTATWIAVDSPLVTEWDSPTASAWIGDEAAYSGGTYPTAAHSGTQWVDLNAQSIFQNVSATYIEGNTYTLTVWALGTTTGQGLYLQFAADSPNGWKGDANEYLAGSSSLIPVPDDESTWLQYSYEYTAVAADAGKTIGINIYGRAQTNVDGVSLTVYVQGPTEVLDPSFEVDLPHGSPGDRGYDYVGSLVQYYGYTAWNTDGGSIIADANFSYTNGMPDTVPDGHQAARGMGAYVYQVLPGTYVEGYTYTLSFWATATDTNGYTYAYLTDGSISNGYPISGENLMAGGGAAAPSQAWTQVTHTFTAAAADAGKPIGIAIYGRQNTYMDDVALLLGSTITGFSPSGSGVVEMEFICPSLETSYPFTKADLVDGSWTNVEHSIDGNAPWYTTNLSYSGTVSGSTNKIFLKTTEDAAFFSIGD